MDFLDIFVNTYIKPNNLCEDKARKWFTGDNQFIIDVYAKEFSVNVRNDFYNNLNLNLSCQELLQVYTQLPSWDKGLNKLILVWFKKTIFGLMKYCLESENWGDPVIKDNIYRFEWFHHVIGNQIDWGLYAHLKNGIKNRKICVSIPPQHGKSYLGSGVVPALFLGNSPTIHGLIASYSQPMGHKLLNRDFNNFVASKGYAKLFKNLFACNFNEALKKEWRNAGRKIPTDTRDTKATTKGGQVFAGSLSDITGKRGGFLILDDPIPDYQTAMSETYINNVINNLETSFNTRSNSNTFKILLQTRWSTRDPIGYTVEKEKLKKDLGYDFKFYNICLRAFYDPTDDFDYDFRTKKDEMLWESFHAEKYVDAKVSDNAITYNALFQQRPIDEQGQIFAKEDFKRFYDCPTKFSQLVISVDTSYNDKKTSNKCAIGVFGITNNGHYYLIHLVYDRMNYNRTKDELVSIIHQYPNYSNILIEKKSAGQAIIDSLIAEFPKIIGIDVTESKKARAYAVQPIVKSGNFFLPYTQDGEEFLQQMTSFKGVGDEKDDLVDIFTQMARYCDETFKPYLNGEDILVESRTKNLNYEVNGSDYFKMFNKTSEATKKIFSKFKGNDTWL